MEVLTIAAGILLAMFIYQYRAELWAFFYPIVVFVFTWVMFGVLGLAAAIVAG